MIVNETLRVIKQRRSIRSYTDEQITDDELQAVLEAGMYASYAGGQAWHFTVVQNRELLQQLNLAAKEAARQMSMYHLQALGNDEQFDCLYGAPTLIIVGRHDFITTVGMSEEIHQHIPCSRLEVFEDSGHFTFVEEPARLKELAREFLCD
jgi:nitroreductase